MTLKEATPVSNMLKTVYIYDKQSGRVQYTIDNVDPNQIRNMNLQDKSFYVGPPNQRLAGTFVKIDPSSGEPIGISPIQHMTFVNINKHVIVANGTDTAVITGFRKGMSVDINHEHKYTVEDEDDMTLELSCNNFSYIPQHNEMVVYLKAYGCHDSSVKINVVEE